MAYGKAQEEVLDIPELFSAILIHLPVLDLLLCAPLVNHAWNSRIANSPTLQSKLFFHPRKHHARRKPEVNPLLQAAFPPWFHNRPIDYDYPALMFTSLHWTGSHAKRSAFLNKEASWRRMLPVQPPPQQVEVVKLTCPDDQQFESRGVLRFENGVRMGTLCDLGYHTVMELGSPFWISWPMFPDMDCQDFGWVCWDEDEDECEEDGFGYDARSEGMEITFTMSCTNEEHLERKRLLRLLERDFRNGGYEEVDLGLGAAKLLQWNPLDEVWNYDPNKYGI